MQNKPRSTTSSSHADEPPSSVDIDSTSADHGLMKHRVTTLERTSEKILARLDAIESRLYALEKEVALMAHTLSTFVTKDMLHRELHSLTWKIFGGAALLVAAVYFIARNVAPPIYVQVTAPAQAKPPSSQTR